MKTDPRDLGPLLTRAEAASVAGRRASSGGRSRSRAGMAAGGFLPSRFRCTASRDVLVLATSLDVSDESLDRLRRHLLFGLAARAARRDLRGLPARGRGAAAGRGDAPQGDGDLGGDAGQPAAGSGRARRGLAACRDSERDARPARDGVRARATLRRGRQPRAADPARAAPNGARARPSPSALTGRAGGGAALRGRGDRPPDGARRRPAGDRTCRPGRAAGQPRARDGAGAACSRRRPLLATCRGARTIDRGRGRRRTWSSRPTPGGWSRRSGTSSTTLSCTARAR